MADFRVAEHHRWRNTAEEVPPVREPVPGPDASEWSDVPLDDPEDASDATTPATGPAQGAAVRLLRAPARLHDLLFRPLQGHRFLFLSARFLLVLVAVLLIVQGVSGAAEIRMETGADRSVTNPATVPMHLAPGSTHKYPIEVSTGSDDRISALFTKDHGVVRLPASDDEGAAYGMHVGVTRSHSSMRVDLLVAKPGESYRNAPVIREEGDLVVFDAGRLVAPGEYGLLVRSTQGVGPAKLAITIVEAPVERVGAERLEWFPLISGAALATVLVGPYLPGAAASSALPATFATRNTDRVRASPVIVVGDSSPERRRGA